MLGVGRGNRLNMALKALASGGGRSPDVRHTDDQGQVPSASSRRPGKPTAKALQAVRPIPIAYALLVCGLLVISAAEFDPLSPLLLAGLKAVLGVAVVVVAAAWYAGGRLRVWAYDLTVAVAGAYCALTVAAALHATPYPVGGLVGDVGFRVAAVARFADTWQYLDFTYEGLPAFYPLTVPYLAGRVAWLTGLPPYLAFKYATVVVICAIPVLAYPLWRRILPSGQAALVCLAVFVPVLAGALVRKPAEWLVLFIIVPWWIDAIYDIRRTGVGRWPLWAHGLVGAALFCTYYYFYLVLAIGLLLALVLDRWHPPEPRVWRRRFGIIALIALLSSVYWAPLLASIVRAQQPSFLQSMYFDGDHADLPLPMFTFSVFGAVMLVGLAHIAWSARRQRTSAALLLLTAAAYLYYVLGLFAATAGHPILVARTRQFIVLVLLVAGVRALVLGAEHAMRRWSLVDARRVVAVAGVGLALYAGQLYTDDIPRGIGIERAHNQALPSGRLPRYHTADAEPPSVPARELLSTVRAGYRGSGQPIVLSARADILKLSPQYGFNQWNAHYAHPAGEFEARLDFLRRLQHVSDPTRFARITATNRFDRIDALVLRETGRGLRYRCRVDDFPYRSKKVDLYFARSQISPRFWQVTDLGQYVVAVRR